MVLLAGTVVNSGLREGEGGRKGSPLKLEEKKRPPFGDGRRIAHLLCLTTKEDENKFLLCLQIGRPPLP